MSANFVTIEHLGAHKAFHCPACGSAIIRNGEMTHSEWCSHLIGVIPTTSEFFSGPSVTQDEEETYLAALSLGRRVFPDRTLLSILPETAICFLLVERFADDEDGEAPISVFVDPLKGMHVHEIVDVNELIHDIKAFRRKP